MAVSMCGASRSRSSWKKFVFGVRRRPVADSRPARRSRRGRAESPRSPREDTRTSWARVRTPICWQAGRCAARRPRDAALVTMYWCSTGSTGTLEPDHCAGPAREIAGCRDDMLGDDVAFVGAHQPLAAGCSFDRGDGGVAIDLGERVPRSLGERLGQVGGLDIAIGMLDRPDQAVGLQSWRSDRLDLRRGEHVRLATPIVRATPADSTYSSKRSLVLAPGGCWRLGEIRHSGPSRPRNRR